jgi:septum formation protein
LALAKAAAVLGKNPDALVIGGDTVVAIAEADGVYRHLAKPLDASDAAEMLRALSGREHLVITGVALVMKGNQAAATDTTRVFFRELHEDEIEHYVSTGEPMDKAGAYAIQGGAKDFVQKIEGSWSNVVGLPVELLRQMLTDFPMGSTLSM